MLKPYLPVAAGIALSCAAAIACAQGRDAKAYPEKTIRFIVPVAAGGSVDLAARLVSQKLTKAPEIKERFAADGAEGVGSTQDEFAAFIRSETDKWAKVVKQAGLKAD